MMTDQIRQLVKFGIILSLICIQCIPAFAADTVASDPGVQGPGIPGISLPGMNIAEPKDGSFSLGAAKLNTPVLLSPVNNSHLLHYPRATTLAWKNVPHATNYIVEVQYYFSGWHSSIRANKTPTYFADTSYTFNFVGDQPGRWRVTANDTTKQYLSSDPSAWRLFDFNGVMFKLPTPVPITPANNSVFYHYPRATTLAWKPVAGAASYNVEVQYYNPGVWTTWGPITSTTNPYRTFNFVGAQPGRWRVSAIGSGQFATSDTSIWRYFTYTV